MAPLGDVTLEAVAEPGWTVEDPQAAFVKRVTAPAFLRDHATALEDAGGQPADGLPRALLARGAAELLEITSEAYPWLRACGAALTSVSGPPSPVRLRLDDLELACGTTERSADVLAAAEAPAAYEPELDAALARCDGADVVRLVLDRDQRLPAVLSLAARLASRTRLEVAGAFAHAHATALSRLEPLRTAVFVDALLRWRIRPPPGLASEPAAWTWCPDVGAGPWSLGGTAAPWAGRVPLGWLARRPEALASCRTTVVTFVTAGAEVVDAEGHAWPRGEILRGARLVRERGGTVVAEWLVGAPGTGRERLLESVSVLAGDSPFHRLAGFRRFTWPVTGAVGWAGAGLRAAEVPEGHDLARTRPFHAPGTLTGGALDDVIAELAARMPDARGPGSCALAYTADPPASFTGLPDLMLDPDCAVVRSDEGWRAVNLRTGTVVGLDERLARRLHGLRRPVRRAEALSAVPAAKRDTLVATLQRRGVLWGTGP